MALSFFSLYVSCADDDVMKKVDDTYVVNTTTLCDKRGFKSTTPLEVHIRNGRVVKIVALPNKESYGYFNPMARQLFALYDNMKVSKAVTLSEDTSVDAITGATFSGKAVQANINAALLYYQKNR